MQGKRSILFCVALIALAFQAGRLSTPATVAKADDGGTPQADVRQVGPGTNLVVYYPNLKKMYFYQPFVGQPTWPCAYSIQIGTPGGSVERQPCSNSD